MSDYTNTPIGSGYNATSAINTELSAVETAVNSKLDKSGSTMTGELDMNSKKIINLPDATTLQEPVTYGQMINGASFAAADAKYFATVALATADTTLGVGDVVIIEERANGIFNVISGTGTANTYNIIAHGTLSLSLELREEIELNVKTYGATGDGVTDDTAALQAAFDKTGNIFIPDGTYITLPLTLSSNTTLTLTANTLLLAKTGYGYTDFLLGMDGINDVNIHGNGGEIRMLKAEYTTGEFRHCIRMYESKQINIRDIHCNDSGGDGFSIGGNNHCENVSIINCYANNNKRQGLSITNCIGCHVIGGAYTGTDGIAPQYGIDIESNSNPLYPDYYLTDINIVNVYTANNTGGGIRIAPQASIEPVSISVRNCTSFYDGIDGAFDIRGVLTPMLGTIDVEDCLAITPQGNGLTMNRWTQNAPITRIKNITVYNPGSNAALATTDLNRNGFLFRVEPADTYGTSYGHFELDGLNVIDDRATTVTQIPVYINNAHGSLPTKDILIKNVSGDNWTSAEVAPFVVSTTTFDNVRFLWDEPNRVVGSSSHTLFKTEIGSTIVCDTAATYTLPLLSAVPNATYIIEVGAAIPQLVPQAGESILNYSPYAGAGVSGRRSSGVIAVKSTTAGWLVTQDTGGWGILTHFAERYPTSSFTAAPTTGTWARGDIIWNYEPSASGTIGWTCVTAGTPGTWKSFGTISA